MKLMQLLETDMKWIDVELLLVYNTKNFLKIFIKVISIEKEENTDINVYVIVISKRIMAGFCLLFLRLYVLIDFILNLFHFIYSNKWKRKNTNQYTEKIN